MARFCFSVMTLMGTLSILCLSAVARADKPEEIAAQKKSTLANLKKAKLESFTHAETDDLLIFAGLTEAKLKPLAEALQKVATASKKELRFEASEKFWPGKLTVMLFPDPKVYGSYIRLVQQRRPEKGETFAVNLKGDAPIAILAVDRGERVSDADFQADASMIVAAAYLNKKAGLAIGEKTLPEWIMSGFGRLIAAKADNNSTKFAAYRSKVRAVTLGGKKTLPPRLVDLWDGQKAADEDYL
ncbi:MAG: hypothetical protein ACRCZF_19520, partial [Gemmataceae bacterium]